MSCVKSGDSMTGGDIRQVKPEGSVESTKVKQPRRPCMVQSSKRTHLRHDICTRNKLS